MVSRLNALGPAANIFKIDISRAFRHVRIDPGDIDLLGLRFRDQYYADLALPFGFHLGSIFFQGSVTQSGILLLAWSSTPSQLYR